MLSGLAPLLHVRPELEDFCRFGGDWRSPHDQMHGGAHFHIVTQGQCVLERSHRDVLTLQAGDVLLLPHGDRHVLRAPNAGPAGGPPVSVTYSNAIRIKTSVGVGIGAELICGSLHFEVAPDNLVIAALPDVIVLRAGQEALAERFVALMASIRDELDGARPGAASIAADLARAMFVMMLRRHLEDHPPPAGLLALLAHGMTAPAALAMLRDPARDWSLDALADIAAASRATLVRAFRKTAGVPPLTFLMGLRLGLARQLLLAGHESVGQIADAVGYQSEAAFSRAFLRQFGVRPGRLRGRKAAAF
ncbi:MAG TPA: AraC family transcriptional regulator [Acidocella sp.]|jgi:AraC family transcriptional activator of mtrCDE|uniref:AraC family transcriptional regulator n=1 Tax=Acidocella sp. TaxID=50710 RepID=UPI002B80EAF0|nr:AraC family transcriptional regulator [Acidocella sp.]HVE20983.1 AraC family transcriptional regulator [Acidocella sp.]